MCLLENEQMYRKVKYSCFSECGYITDPVGTMCLEYHKNMIFLVWE